MTNGQVRCIKCLEPSVPGKSRCAEHITSNWDRRPPSKAYSGRWASIARKVLQRDGFICQLAFPGICKRRASQADHITAVAEGGTNELDNLRAVCPPCHRRRSAQQGAAAVNQRRTRNVQSRKEGD
jgi:5-methylcytosine-specific restriction enzyme A